MFDWTFFRRSKIFLCIHLCTLILSSSNLYFEIHLSKQQFPFPPFFIKGEFGSMNIYIIFLLQNRNNYFDIRYITIGSMLFFSKSVILVALWLFAKCTTKIILYWVSTSFSECQLETDANKFWINESRYIFLLKNNNNYFDIISCHIISWLVIFFINDLSFFLR